MKIIIIVLLLLLLLKMSEVRRVTVWIKVRFFLMTLHFHLGRNPKSHLIQVNVNSTISLESHELIDNPSQEHVPSINGTTSSMHA